MFKKIEEYIKLSKNERQQHLKLNEQCIKIGGRDSGEYRGLLAHFLRTTIPTKMKIILCHACHNPRCSNPQHLYWGTYAENLDDSRENGKYKSIWQRTIDKYGLKKAKEIYKNNAIKNACKRKKNSLTQNEIEYRWKVIHDSDYLNWGWKTKSAKKLSISHSQISRFVEKYPEK